MGDQTVCEDPEDSENCRLMYMDSDGKYVCVNECPAGTDKDADNNICVPDLKHDRKAIMAVVLLIISLINVGLVASTVAVLCSEKKQKYSRFTVRSKQQNFGRAVEMR